eukprot:g195.t1
MKVTLVAVLLLLVVASTSAQEMLRDEDIPEEYADEEGGWGDGGPEDGDENSLLSMNAADLLMGGGGGGGEGGAGGLEQDDIGSMQEEDFGSQSGIYKPYDGNDPQYSNTSTSWTFVHHTKCGSRYFPCFDEESTMDDSDQMPDDSIREMMRDAKTDIHGAVLSTNETTIYAVDDKLIAIGRLAHLPEYGDRIWMWRRQKSDREEHAITAGPVTVNLTKPVPIPGTKLTLPIGALTAVGNRAGEVHGVVNEGQTRWSRVIGTEPVRYVAASANGKTIFASSGSTVVGLDSTDGSVRWSRNLGGSGGLAANFVVDLEDSVVAMVERSGGITVLEALFGTTRWSAQAFDAAFLEKFDDVPVLLGAYNHRTILAGTRRGTFAAFTLTSGARKWNIELEGEEIEVVTNQRSIYHEQSQAALIAIASSDEGTGIYALDLSEGTSTLKYMVGRSILKMVPPLYIPEVDILAVAGAMPTDTDDRVHGFVKIWSEGSDDPSAVEMHDHPVQSLEFFHEWGVLAGIVEERYGDLLREIEQRYNEDYGNPEGDGDGYREDMDEDELRAQEEGADEEEDEAEEGEKETEIEIDADGISLQKLEEEYQASRRGAK